MNTLPQPAYKDTTTVVRFGNLEVTVAMTEQEGRRRLLICRDENWVGHVRMYLAKGIDPDTIWWLVDRQELSPLVGWQGGCEIGASLVLLRSLQMLMPQRSIVDRLFDFGQREVTSYSIKLPRSVHQAKDELESEYLKKSAIARFFHFNTNLNGSMLKRDVFDEARADQAIVIAAGRLDQGASEDVITLPDVVVGHDVHEVSHALFARRKSSRKYQASMISKRQLATLLKLGCGLREVRKNVHGEDVHFYHYPVGGGIKSTSVYCHCVQVDSVPQGIYLYHPLKHALLRVNLEVTADDLARISAYGDTFARSSVILFVVVDFYAKSLKYLDRAYRVLISEAGHLSQNLHMAATALELKSCVLMGFDDERLNGMMNFNTEQMAVISLLTVGT